MVVVAKVQHPIYIYIIIVTVIIFIINIILFYIISFTRRLPFWLFQFSKPEDVRKCLRLRYDKVVFWVFFGFCFCLLIVVGFCRKRKKKRTRSAPAWLDVDVFVDVIFSRLPLFFQHFGWQIINSLLMNAGQRQPGKLNEKWEAQRNAQLPAMPIFFMAKEEYVISPKLLASWLTFSLCPKHCSQEQTSWRVSDFLWPGSVKAAVEVTPWHVGAGYLVDTWSWLMVSTP